MRVSMMNRYGRAGALGAGVLAATVLGACEVTNPGPIQDEFLSEPGAEEGLINGAQRTLAEDLTDLILDVSLVARELFPGGQTGAWGAPVDIHAGVIDRDYGPSFDDLHEARFIAETAVKRFTEGERDPSFIHQGHIWAGHSYRLLGELWCDTVLPDRDPSVTEASEYIEGTTDPYFERAVEHFTSALELAATPRERHEALAGRASAHLWLENWDQALADAREVPDGFRFVVEQDDSENGLYNYLAEGNSGTFRSYSVQFTWFHDYYDETGDPRTPWGVDPEFDVAVGSLSGFPGGQVPYKPQLKYTSRSDNVNLSSGWEMRLVEAEAILQGAGSGDFNEAMDLINHVRTRNVSDHDGSPLEPWEASSAEEAWTYLKRERGIELWLEGRRMADQRRWQELNTPGDIDLPSWEDPSHPGHSTIFLRDQTRQYLCFDIPSGERERNPNVPTASDRGSG